MADVDVPMADAEVPMLSSEVPMVARSCCPAERLPDPSPE